MKTQVAKVMDADVNEDIRTTRKQVRLCFNKVSGFYLPYPGEEVSESDTYTGDVNQIRPLFVEMIEAYVRKLFLEQLNVKRIHGREVGSWLWCCVSHAMGGDGPPSAAGDCPRAAPLLRCLCQVVFRGTGVCGVCEGVPGYSLLFATPRLLSSPRPSRCSLPRLPQTTDHSPTMGCCTTPTPWTRWAAWLCCASTPCVLIVALTCMCWVPLCVPVVWPSVLLCAQRQAERRTHRGVRGGSRYV